MEGPLIKKRTRVKVNKPLLSPDSQKPDDTLEGVKGESENTSPKTHPPEITVSSLRDISSEDETGTYKVPDEILKIPDDSGEATDASDVEQMTVEKEHVASPPVPAPRRNVTPQMKDEVEQLEEQNSVPPQPLPRVRRVRNEEEAKKTEKARKKKRKAAEVIASVLRRESKKLPRVATVLQEAEDREKEKEEGDIGSPWDSPPPPQCLEKVYIQHKYGFSVRDWCDFYSKPEAEMEAPRERCAADVALAFHGLWSRLSVFSHGVVAGVACCHSLAVAAALAATQSRVPEFVQFYHFLSLKVHFAVYIFTTLCIISSLDRLDVGQFSRAHMRVVFGSHGTLLVTLGYVLCLALSLAAHRHTAAIEAYSSDHSLWDAQGLQEWTCLVTVRDVLLLLCWVFMACSRPADFLQDKLRSMGSRESKSDVSQFADA